MKSRFIWCLGMYASASTWLFNAVRQICLASQPSEVTTIFVKDAVDFRAFDQLRTINLVKSHEIEDESTIVELAQRADSILISLRDPRDAVASLMQYHRHDFDRALQLTERASALCHGFAKDRRTTLFHYEAKFFEQVTTIEQLSKRLGYATPKTAAQAIFDQLDRAAVEKYISSLPQQKGVLRAQSTGDFLDPHTHWHTHHAGRSGEIGRWQKVLSETQAKEVERRLLA